MELSVFKPGSGTDVMSFPIWCGSMDPETGKPRTTSKGLAFPVHADDDPEPEYVVDGSDPDDPELSSFMWGFGSHIEPTSMAECDRCGEGHDHRFNNVDAAEDEDEDPID